MSLEVVILAAGDGKRMQSDLPKVLHPVGGEPMLKRVIATAKALKPEAVHVVYGMQSEKLHQVLDELAVNKVLQEKPLGTGHAVASALPFLKPESRVLVLFGDVPLIRSGTLKRLIEETIGDSLGLLCVKVPDPAGFGRVVRNKEGQVKMIVEEKDADLEIKKIEEIFSGILLTTTEALKKWLPQLDTNNAQQEYYLTRIVDFAVNDEKAVVTVEPDDIFEVQGVNNRLQLIDLERIYQENQAKSWMLQGISIMDPKRFDVRGTWSCGRDTIIDVNVVLEGNGRIGTQCKIGSHCVIKNCEIGDNVVIHSHTILDGARVESGCEVGPFARIRPGTVLKSQVKVGNFVEIKKSQIGIQSKVNHLSYIGDASIGEGVNIGAGTITCNYDGANKHETIIEDGAFIGSDTQLVAPVKVGKNATIGAGSTIRKDAPADQLTLNEVRQKSIAGWKRPRKKMD